MLRASLLEWIQNSEKKKSENKTANLQNSENVKRANLQNGECYKTANTTKQLILQNSETNTILL